MRGLDEDTCAIAGIGLATASAAMVEIQKDLQGLANDGMGFLAFDIDDETNSAGFVFELGIVQALLWRRSGPRRLAGLSSSATGHLRRFASPLRIV